LSHVADRGNEGDVEAGLRTRVRTLVVAADQLRRVLHVVLAARQEHGAVATFTYVIFVVACVGNFHLNHLPGPPITGGDTSRIFLYPPDVPPGNGNGPAGNGRPAKRGIKRLSPRGYIAGADDVASVGYDGAHLPVR
jgi:hypothetical protein